MSKIWDLIKNEKVEWKTIGEVCELIQGYSFSAKKFQTNGDYKIIRISNIKNNEIETQNVVYVSKNEYKDIDLTKYKINQNDILIAMSGASVGKIGLNYSDETNLFLNQRVGKFRPNSYVLNNMYLYFWLSEISESLVKNIQNQSIANLSTEMILRYEIPIPSIDVQNEIVKILDKFNIYVKELERELERRNKQYKYYLNTLLTNKNSNVCKIGEVCEIYSGGDVKKENVRRNPDSVYKYPIYSNGIKENSLYGYTNTYKIQDKCITISARGTIGWSCLRNEKFTPIVRLLCVFPKEQIILTEYLKYFLDIIEFNVPDGGIPQLTKPMLEETDVWFPDIKKQIEIIRILDKFDDITNNILIGLPKEIKLRKQQYEYYRNKLLDFPKN